MALFGGLGGEDPRNAGQKGAQKASTGRAVSLGSLLRVSPMQFNVSAGRAASASFLV